MKWVKKGHVFKPNGEYDWMNSHTTPIAVVPLDDKIRVFLSTRSKKDSGGNFISYASFIDLDKQNPKNVVYKSNKPMINLGDVGMFDEYGIMVAKPVIISNVIYMYYMGWQRLSGNTAPYQVMLGLAVSSDNGLSFSKVSDGPIIGIDRFDPISIGNVSVIFENGVWRMWYTSFTRWGMGGIKPTPEYNIKYAYSFDGISWTKTNVVCIDQNENGGVATPSVIKIDNTYHMWFGYRPSYTAEGQIAGYQIGYAWSLDGISWHREDANAGISPSNIGWDSEMICYPHVVQIDGQYLMFYCGNGFGESGFGYAQLE
jgi:hypothetical protein